MTEVARSAGKSSEIERGEVPELAALGNMLRELFNAVGVSQRQYAKRIVLDPSAVSRYLGGQRLAPWRFVEQLIGEVEEAQGGSVTPEAKETIRAAWLNALKACDPDEYQLEGLRSELAKARRDAERAARNIEALHLLLEQKESQARRTTDDMTRLRLDWAADLADAGRTEIELRRERDGLSASRDALLREIEELRNDLREAERLRADAEAHCRELREQVLRLEAELAERCLAGEIPLEAFKEQLEWLWVEEEFAEAARDLTEAAWGRSVEEAVDLVAWLDDGRDEARLIAFLTDVCRLRPLHEVVHLVKESMPRFEVLFLQSFETMSNAFASRITPRNAAALYRGLTGPDLDWSMGDEVLTSAVLRAASPLAAVELIVAALAGIDSHPPFHMTASQTARHHLDRGFPAAVVSGLVDADLLHEAGQILGRLRTTKAERRLDAYLDLLHRGLRQLDEPTIRTFFMFVAEQADWPVALRFADDLIRAGQVTDDLTLIDELADLMEPKYWQLLGEHSDSVGDELSTYFTNRRRT